MQPIAHNSPNQDQRQVFGNGTADSRSGSDQDSSYPTLDLTAAEPSLEQTIRFSILLEMKKVQMDAGQWEQEAIMWQQEAVKWKMEAARLEQEVTELEHITKLNHKVDNMIRKVDRLNQAVNKLSRDIDMTQQTAMG
ncbi:hypothetical protein BU24DRAFT_453219 [Aaosphaeria arxii CBS 175.79]|uniref:Uncharacterized protein n=1 Tax=Aaosphaeria arxii CBS 175.79 TaxID=1450172 RepID=A0A6A5XJA3_9PLEO|nr:uncharacterized protein BU24DRAFT_453219 [Aaosphaeria arxii CBS 175.79]KAF2012911.1 hypothetical protein BU24DRAFT_453219 [Aaosphaeria arxii CBS 175.79]